MSIARILVFVIASKQGSSKFYDSLPALIASAPIETVLEEDRRKAFSRQLTEEGKQILESYRTITNTYPAEMPWPPDNPVLEYQCAKSRAKVKIRDNDVIIVSYPKVLQINFLQLVFESENFPASNLASTLVKCFHHVAQSQNY